MTEVQLTYVCDILLRSGVGVMPTDTIYGLVARAHDHDAVAKIYDLKNRNTERPFLVVISELAQINDFGIVLSDMQKDIAQIVWSSDKAMRGNILRSCNIAVDDHDRPISIVMKCDDKKYAYLHKGQRSIGFRLVKRDAENVHAHDLACVVNRVGPVIATSANISGQPFATSICEAQKYFGDRCDFYIEHVTQLYKKPSIVLAVQDEGVELVRS
jgi:L-threonylcarbamoyladenylate synthase